MHFSEIIKLKFEKKLPYILCILTLFRIMVASLSQKMPGYRHFSFWIPMTLAEIYFSLLGGTVLKLTDSDLQNGLRVRD